MDSLPYLVRWVRFWVRSWVMFALRLRFEKINVSVIELLWPDNPDTVSLGTKCELLIGVA